MDFRDQVFLAVAENMSITKAADKLFISQPAVTKHIKELEAKLKITLFQREGNKLVLTKAGKITFFHLKKIREQYEELSFEISGLNEEFEGRLRISASYTISQYIIADVIAVFNKRYSNIKVCLSEGNADETLMKLTQNDADLALVGNATSDNNIKYIDFYDEEIFVVTGINSSYAMMKSIKLDDLATIPIVLQEKGSGILEVMQQFFEKNRIVRKKIDTCLKMGSTETVKSFLKNFDGIAFVTEKSIEKELKMKMLIIIPLEDMSIKRKLKIATRQGHLNFTAELFKNFLLHYNF
jgi:DNA-binding transcriptional LysR family regulator